MVDAFQDGVQGVVVPGLDVPSVTSLALSLFPKFVWLKFRTIAPPVRGGLLTFFRGSSVDINTEGILDGLLMNGDHVTI